jgi:hypothetical protein
MTAQLEDKFKTSTKSSEQLQILTILHQSWSGGEESPNIMKQYKKQFGASNYRVRNANL